MEPDDDTYEINPTAYETDFQPIVRNLPTGLGGPSGRPPSRPGGRRP